MEKKNINLDFQIDQLLLPGQSIDTNTRSNCHCVHFLNNCATSLAHINLKEKSYVWLEVSQIDQVGNKLEISEER